MSQPNYQEELEVARKVQQGLLNAIDVDIPGLTIAHKCVPASDIGGDFYTFIQHEYSTFTDQSKKRPGVVEFVNKKEEFLGVCIGDVAGHGVSSALIMALSAGIINQVGKFSKSPHKVLARVNNNLAKYISHTQIRYVTALYCMIFVSTFEIKFAKGGHLPGLLCRQNGHIEELDAGGLFLGMFPDEIYECGSVQLEQGDRLLLYTDGITERINQENEQFGDSRFRSFIQQNKHLPPQDFVDHLIETLNYFAEGLPSSDDQTIVVIDRD